jgi:transcriptional regulator with PAS, ATPase and Fis domain
VSSDVRIITATNRNLAERVQEGLFRQDLFFRIHIIDIVMPPLRERSEDIPFLVSHFIEGFNNRLGRSITGLSSEAMFALMAHQWPGNIRELENVIERGFVLCDQLVIGIEHLPQALWPVKPGRTQSDSGAIRPARDMAEVQSILAALERTKHNHREAARELGIHKTTLYRKMKRLGMDG